MPEQKKEDKAKKFKNSTEFLNFMDARCYEMLDQKKEKLRTDYTFKKKK
jgi:hypothetical protein